MSGTGHLGTRRLDDGNSTLHASSASDPIDGQRKYNVYSSRRKARRQRDRYANATTTSRRDNSRPRTDTVPPEGALHHFLYVLSTSLVSARSIATVTMGFSPVSVSAGVLGGGGETELPSASAVARATSSSDDEVRTRFDENELWDAHVRH